MGALFSSQRDEPPYSADELWEIARYGKPFDIKRIARYTYRPSTPNFDVPTCVDIYCYACIQGHTDMAKQILHAFPPRNKGELFNTFYATLEGGFLEIAQQIYASFPHLTLEYNTQQYDCVCSHGHLHIIKWLNETFVDFDTKFAPGSGFLSACVNGHLELVWWLVSRYPIDAVHLEAGFMHACMYGHDVLARWLLREFPAINVRAQHNRALRGACNYWKTPDVMVYWLIGFYSADEFWTQEIQEYIAPFIAQRKSAIADHQAYFRANVAPELPGQK